MNNTNSDINNNNSNSSNNVSIYHVTWNTRDWRPLLTQQVSNCVCDILKCAAKPYGGEILECNASMFAQLDFKIAIPKSASITTIVYDLKRQTVRQINQYHPEIRMKLQLEPISSPDNIWDLGFTIVPESNSENKSN